MDGQVGRQVDDGWMDGKVGRQVDDGWMEELMDGWKGRQVGR